MKKMKLPQLLLAAAMALPLMAGAEEGLPPEADRPLLAGPRGDGSRHFAGPGLPFLHGLDLSESQEDKLFQLMHNQAPYLREQQRSHDKAMRALHDMRNAEKFDDAAATRLAQAAAQAQANLAMSHIRTHQKVLALLTPEQRKQVDDRRAGRQRGGFNER